MKGRRRGGGLRGLGVGGKGKKSGGGTRQTLRKRRWPHLCLKCFYFLQACVWKGAILRSLFLSFFLFQAQESGVEVVGLNFSNLRVTGRCDEGSVSSTTVGLARRSSLAIRFSRESSFFYYYYLTRQVAGAWREKNRSSFTHLSLVIVLDSIIAFRA